jgi:hypothetical protein
MWRPSHNPAIFQRLINALISIYFASPTAPDALATLAIICDFSSVIASHFTVSTMFINFLAISSIILQVLMISDTLLSSLRPLALHKSPFVSLRPILSQKPAETSQFQSETLPNSKHTSSTFHLIMPTRGDPSAPKFDPNQPRELRRYFADLALRFEQSHIADSQQKKVHTCRYVDIDTADLWESLSEFSSLDKSYSDFIRAIHRLYPGSEGQRQWLVVDMERLVEERCCIKIRTLGDFSDYFREFIAITMFLRHKNRLSDIEEGQHFM